MARRQRRVAIALIATSLASVAIVAATAYAKDKYYECNRCHQQFFGGNPPRNVVCPSGDGKQKHWWVPKYK